MANHSVKFKEGDVVKIQRMLDSYGKKLVSSDLNELIGKTGIIIKHTPHVGHFDYLVKLMDVREDYKVVKFNPPEMKKATKKETKLFKEALIENEI